MSIQKICFGFALAAMPFAANADTRSWTNGCGIGGQVSQQEGVSEQQATSQQTSQQETTQQETSQQQPVQQDCRAFNQSGTTCAQVGFSEGQYGAPWGHQFGFFVCANRCLHWAGWGAQNNAR